MKKIIYNILNQLTEKIRMNFTKKFFKIILNKRINFIVYLILILKIYQNKIEISY